jgi:hypothetical protein
MYKFICIDTYVQIHLCTYTYIYSIHICTYLYIHTYIDAYICIHRGFTGSNCAISMSYTVSFDGMLYVYVHIFVYQYVSLYVCVYLFSSVYTNICNFISMSSIVSFDDTLCVYMQMDIEIYAYICAIS